MFVRTERYDLESDPAEQTDIHEEAEPTPLEEDLNEFLADHEVIAALSQLADTDSGGHKFVSADAKDRLEELGYL